MSDLVYQRKNNPKKHRVEKAKVKEAKKRVEIITETILMMQTSNIVIANANMVCRQVMDDHNLWVNEFQVRQVMKKDFKLSFIKVKKLAPQANSDLNLVLRQQFALKLMEHLHEGKRVINIDETWLNETSHVRRTWA